MQDQLSPRQFAEAIGVSESSVRRWADGGQIRMTRTAGGHRKIHRKEAIRFVREAACEVVRPELLQFGERPHRRHRVSAFEAHQEEVFDALANGQADVVLGLLTRMYVNGVSAAEICDGPLRGALRRIGQLWPADERAILVEHRATNICIGALHQLRTNFGHVPRPGAIAIGGAPENDPFILPSLMVSTVLADVGFAPVNLGPNTPLDALVQSARELNASLVWMSFTSGKPKAKLQHHLDQALRRVDNSNTQVVAGGQGLRKLQVPVRKNVHSFRSLSEMAGYAKTLLNV